MSNAARGEATLRTQNAAFMLRPTFAALVAAEEELGPLFALVERAAAGGLKLSEMVALFWHCVVRRNAISREEFAEAVTEAGLAAATPALKVLLGQILGGRGLFPIALRNCAAGAQSFLAGALPSSGPRHLPNWRASWPPVRLVTKSRRTLPNCKN